MSHLACPNAWGVCIPTSPNACVPHGQKSYPFHPYQPHAPLPPSACRRAESPDAVSSLKHIISEGHATRELHNANRPVDDAGATMHLGTKVRTTRATLTRPLRPAHRRAPACTPP